MAASGGGAREIGTRGCGVPGGTTEDSVGLKARGGGACTRASTTCSIDAPPLSWWTCSDCVAATFCGVLKSHITSISFCTHTCAGPSTRYCRNRSKNPFLHCPILDIWYRYRHYN